MMRTVTANERGCNMADLISRESLLKKQIILWDEVNGFQKCVLVEDIEKEPSVERNEEDARI